MRPELTRHEALAVLRLPPSADDREVKRAYRRLARELHPDAGGDADAFHSLQRAYERLLRPDGSGGRRPDGPVARPSRPQGADWAEAPTRPFSDAPADVATVDWDRAVPDPDATVRLDRSLVAVLLARGDGTGSVARLSGRSRGPRSVANRFIGMLDPDLTATWTISTADAGDGVVVRLRVWSRKGRRRIESASLPPGWVTQRASSSTTLMRRFRPAPDLPRTAARVASALEEMLEAAAWPLEGWYSLPGDR